jgi:hypothetical protein
MSTKERSLFLLRRALWTGKATRADLVRAFGIGTNQASIDIRNALNLDWREHLKREDGKEKGAIVPKNERVFPAEASATTMMKLFEENADCRSTGIFEGELNVMTRPVNINRGSDEILSRIINATIAARVIRILYVGLRRGENATWKTLLPRALEFTGRQWRVLAQDINGEGALKTYVIPRILNIEMSDMKIPRAFRLIRPDNVASAYTVTLNSDLTKDQASAIKAEFGIDDDNKMLINERNLYEFMKLYCEDRTNIHEIVWPVIKKITERK